eukprot:s90_g8.t1
MQQVNLPLFMALFLALFLALFAQSVALLQNEHTAPAVSEQELPSDQECSRIGLDRISLKRSKVMTFFVSAVLSMCLSITPWFLFEKLFTADGKHVFELVFPLSLSAWLWTLWWDDSETLLKGIPALVSWTLAANSSDILQKVLNPDPGIRISLCDCDFDNSSLCALEDSMSKLDVATTKLLSLLGYWLALLVGLVRIFEGSATTPWTCLFTWTVFYACGSLLLFTTNQCSDRKLIQHSIIIIFFVGGIWFSSQAACSIYVKLLKLWKPLTDNMKQFVVVDVVSMITFSYYSWLLIPPIAQVVSRVCLCIGWTLSIYFVYDFHCAMAIENREEHDKAFQRACKMSVWLDVGGKIFTYACVVCGAKPHLPPWVAFLELVTTLIEAMQKYSHASRAHAREAPAGSRLTNYLLADQEP